MIMLLYKVLKFKVGSLIQERHTFLWHRWNIYNFVLYSELAITFVGLLAFAHQREFVGFLFKKVEMGSTVRVSALLPVLWPPPRFAWIVFSVKSSGMWWDS